MYERAKQFTLERPKLRRTVGIILILIGLLGLVMPVIPGIVFVVIGLEFFGMRLLFIDRTIDKMMKKKQIPAEEQSL